MRWRQMAADFLLGAGLMAVILFCWWLCQSLTWAGESTMPGERPIARLAGAALSAKCLGAGPEANCSVPGQIIGNSSGVIELGQLTAYGTGTPAQMMLRRATGTIDAPTVPGNGVNLAQFGGAVYDGTGFKAGPGDAYFLFFVDGTVSATSHPVGVSFVTTADGTTTPLQNLIVHSNGTADFRSTVAKYSNIATVSNGVPAEYAKIDTTGLTGNVSSALLYAVPAAGAGMYRISSLVVETTAASVSSTLPNVQIVYTDNDVGSGTVTIDATPVLGVAGIGQTGALTANTVGTTATGVIVINVKASTNINYLTTNYASSTAGMAYAVHVKLEAL